MDRLNLQQNAQNMSNQQPTIGQVFIKQEPLDDVEMEICEQQVNGQATIQDDDLTRKRPRTETGASTNSDNQTAMLNERVKAMETQLSAEWSLRTKMAVELAEKNAQLDKLQSENKLLVDRMHGYNGQFQDLAGKVGGVLERITDLSFGELQDGNRVVVNEVVEKLIGFKQQAISNSNNAFAPVVVLNNQLPTNVRLPQKQQITSNSNNMFIPSTNSTDQLPMNARLPQKQQIISKSNNVFAPVVSLANRLRTDSRLSRNQQRKLKRELTMQRDLAMQKEVAMWEKQIAVPISADDMKKIQDRANELEKIDPQQLSFYLTKIRAQNLSEKAVVEIFGLKKHIKKEANRRFQSISGRNLGISKQRLAGMQKELSSAEAARKISEIEHEPGFKRSALQKFENSLSVSKRKQITDSINNGIYLNAKQLLDKADEYRTQEHYVSALELLHAAVGMMSVNCVVHAQGLSACWHKIGKCYENLNLHDRVVDAYTEAIKHDSTYGGHYYGRAIAYKAMGKYSDAFADAQKCMELWPTYGEVQILQKELNSKIKQE